MPSRVKDPCFCICCCSSIFTFGFLTKNDFSSSLYSSKDSEHVSNKNICIHLALPPNQDLLFKKCNNSPLEQNVDRENVANFRYWRNTNTKFIWLRQFSIFLR